MGEAKDPKTNPHGNEPKDKPERARQLGEMLYLYGAKRGPPHDHITGEHEKKQKVKRGPV